MSPGGWLAVVLCAWLFGSLALAIGWAWFTYQLPRPRSDESLVDELLGGGR